MINIRPANQKLRKRAAGILKDFTGVSEAQAAKALKDSRNILPVAMLMVLRKIPRTEAARQLQGEASVAKVLREAMEGVNQ
jgi:N-acetylmuramic acid 6-phosphate (MurNAc-6-P) etherase